MHVGHISILTNRKNQDKLWNLVNLNILLATVTRVHGFAWQKCLYNIFNYEIESELKFKATVGNFQPLPLSCLIQQTTNGRYFSYFSRKQDLTFYANCLHPSETICKKCQTCFLGKIRKKNQYVVCWQFYLACLAEEIATRVWIQMSTRQMALEHTPMISLLLI